MALALFIPGSFIGFIAAMIEVLVFGASFWTGAATYFGLSLALPIAVSIASYALAALRHSHESRELSKA